MGKLETDYAKYVEAINRSALLTNQYFRRGSHGLKHNFAQERYQQCVARGMSHERALQNTSLELAHFRLQKLFVHEREMISMCEKELDLITQLTTAERKNILKWIASLPEEKVIEIFQAAVKKSFH